MHSTRTLRVKLPHGEVVLLKFETERIAVKELLKKIGLTSSEVIVLAKGQILEEDEVIELDNYSNSLIELIPVVSSG